MPSIYPTLKHSDRKYIRTEKARIRRQFSGLIKQEEMISQLYKRLLPQVKIEGAKEEGPSFAKASEGKAKKVEVKKAEVKKERKVVKKAK